MKIYLATGNKNKKREMCELLPEHTILIPSDEGIDFDPDETGTTFYENSLIKARTLYDIVHCPVIADDSGICVDALGGAPGIFSSRYAGPDFMQGKPDGTKISQEEQNIFLIQQTNEAIADFIRSGISEGTVRKDIDIYPAVIMMWSSISGIISMATDKEEYLKLRFKMSKDEYLKKAYSAFL